jgi:hypothetical protein
MSEIRNGSKFLEKDSNLYEVDFKGLLHQSPPYALGKGSQNLILVNLKMKL